MKYYLLDFVPPSKNNYCFCNAIPDGPYFPYYYLSGGIPVAQEYPDDPFSVLLPLDEDWPSVRLGSFVGNSGQLLIFHKEVAQYLKNTFNLKEVEIFSFTILNHKGRVHSKEYVFFNPIGSFDCIHKELSELEYMRNGDVKGINKLVLDCNKLKNAPDIFRIPEEPDQVLFSQKIIDAVVEQGYTNFEFIEVKKMTGLPRTSCNELSL